MKYIKIFEQFNNLVNEVSLGDYVKFKDNHIGLKPTIEDVNLIKEIIKPISDRHQSRGSSIYYLSSIDILRSFQLTRYYISISGWDRIGELCIFKFSDEWWGITQFKHLAYPHNNFSSYIIDGVDGLREYFNRFS